jgi:plasmid stability protein
MLTASQSFCGARYHRRCHDPQPLSDETHRPLKVRAAQNNRSAEAEIGAILEAAVRPEGRLRLGTAMSEVRRKYGVTKGDIEALELVRDTRPAEPMRFE